MTFTGKTLWTGLPLHVIDFEGSNRTGVVEAGVVTLVNGEIFSTTTQLYAPRESVSLIDTQCHQLKDQDLKNRPPFESEWDYWVSLRRTGLFVAHNSAVESQLLRLTWPRPSVVPSITQSGDSAAEWGPWIDSYRLARLWLPTLGDYKLSSLVVSLKLQPRLDRLAKQYCPPTRQSYHCALYDALAAALILKELCTQGGRSSSTLAQLIQDSLSGSAREDFMQGELGF